ASILVLLIRIRAGGSQHFHDLSTAFIRSLNQRRDPVAIGEVELRMSGDQRRNHVSMTVVGSPHQRTAHFLVQRVDVGSRLQQRIDFIQLAVLRSVDKLLVLTARLGQYHLTDYKDADQQKPLHHSERTLLSAAYHTLLQPMWQFAGQWVTKWLRIK